MHTASSPLSSSSPARPKEDAGGWWLNAQALALSSGMRGGRTRRPLGCLWAGRDEAMLRCCSFVLTVPPGG